MSADAAIQQVWYSRRPLWLFVLLVPLSGLFAGIAWLRRTAYARGLFSVVRLPRPVIVIGNITVGGTGKTPFVIWLAQRLKSKGWQVGIVLRGYAGTSTTWPREVDADTDVGEVGDEAVLLARQTRCIVVAGPDRVAAARRAIELGAEFVLSDDGLQHYRLGRDAEIAVMDERRLLGNRWQLPAGPLREPRSRLGKVDLIVMTRRAAISPPATHDSRLAAHLPSDFPPSIIAAAKLSQAVSLLDGSSRPLESFQHGPVHAVAGIGNPEAFFEALRTAGLTVDARPLPDHAVPSAADIEFADDAPVLMTQKDAVKCRSMADGRHWAIPLDLELSEADAAAVDALVKRLLKAGYRG